jgi:hypothetical protein
MKHSIKMDVSYCFSLDWTPVFECVCGFVCLQEWIPKGHVLKRDWIAFSKCANYFRLNNQHNWGNLYDYLMSMRIVTFLTNRTFIRVFHALVTMSLVSTM